MCKHFTASLRMMSENQYGNLKKLCHIAVGPSVEFSKVLAIELEKLGLEGMLCPLHLWRDRKEIGIKLHSSNKQVRTELITP